MTLAQYRTYKPYPYHVAKYSNFTWTCIPMPGASGSTPSTLVDTSLFALSSRASASKEAKEFMEFFDPGPAGPAGTLSAVAGDLCPPFCRQ